MVFSWYFQFLAAVARKEDEGTVQKCLSRLSAPTALLEGERDSVIRIFLDNVITIQNSALQNGPNNVTV